MGIPKGAAKVDANQQPIVEAMRSVGAHVQIIKDPCDLLIGFRGRPHLMEVKASEAKAKADAKGMSKTQRKQRALRDNFGHVGVTVHVVWTEEMALRAIGAMA
jgi:hypothetical protein